MADTLFCKKCEYAEIDCSLCDVCKDSRLIVAEQKAIPVPLDSGCRWVQPKPAAQ
jgi:hypothetical protein